MENSANEIGIYSKENKYEWEDFLIFKVHKVHHFEASEDTIPKFKSQALHIIRIKYWKASGSGNPLSFIPALPNIAIYVLKTKFYVLFCTRL